MKIYNASTSPKSILYVEENFNPMINKFIVENYDQIVKAFSEDFHINFLYLPYVLKDQAYIEQLQYNHPTFDPSQLNDSNVSDIYRDLIDSEGKTGIGCALLSYDDEKSEKSDFADKLNVEGDLLPQFKRVAHNSREFTIDKAERVGSASSFMGFVTKTQYEVLKDELQELFAGDYQTYLDKIEKGAFKNINNVCSGLIGLNNHLQQNSETLSRLKISGRKGNYTITLTDITTPGGSRVVKMSPLPMTLLIFFLNRPNGMKLSELQNHISVLNKIYCELSKSMSGSNHISTTIMNLVDSNQNSIHENVSLLKRAFVEVMTPLTASNYYINGSKGEIRKITLPRDLIDMDPILQRL